MKFNRYNAERRYQYKFERLLATDEIEANFRRQSANLYRLERNPP